VLQGLEELAVSESGTVEDVGEVRNRWISLSNSETAAIAVGAPYSKFSASYGKDGGGQRTSN
jgi:hypothetical protein